MFVPTIGITLYRAYNRSGYPQLCLNEAYASAVEYAGGLPVLVPLGLPDTKLELLIERLDGILYSGGGDIDPSRYQSQPHPKVENVDADRDRLEIHLTRLVIKKEIPFLGICRGLQVINVAMGGQLYEDILDQCPGSLTHFSTDDSPRDRISHIVAIQDGSRLHQIVNSDELPVNSSHHQAIRILAPDLVPTAFAPDGIIEAFELSNHPFGLAVQWHPEWLLALDSMNNLFREFVSASITAHNLKS